MSEHRQKAFKIHQFTEPIKMLHQHTRTSIYFKESTQQYLEKETNERTTTHEF